MILVLPLVILLLKFINSVTDSDTNYYYITYFINY